MKEALASIIILVIVIVFMSSCSFLIKPPNNTNAVHELTEYTMDALESHISHQELYSYLSSSSDIIPLNIEKYFLKNPLGTNNSYYVSFMFEPPPTTRRYLTIRTAFTVHSIRLDKGHLKYLSLAMRRVFYYMNCWIGYAIILYLGILALWKILSNFLFETKKTHAVIWLYGIGVVILWASIIWILPTAKYRNYADSGTELTKILSNNLSNFEAWFKNKPTGLYSTPAYLQKCSRIIPPGDLTLWPTYQQECNIGADKIFIANTPEFAFNYGRINIDTYTFLFYAPEADLAMLQSINPDLSFRKAGRNIWIGQYKNYIFIVQLLIVGTFLWYGLTIIFTILFVRDLYTRLMTSNKKLYTEKR